jgi:hypothetical protein
VNRDQLEHAIRAACDVSKDQDLIIFGSQAIVGTYPDAPGDLRASIEIDIQPKNRPEAVDEIDGALGELSMFHQTHGFYVHGVSIDSASLPAGWEHRTVAVSDPVGTRGGIGHCIEIHDLAASKLAAWREKDRVFVTTLLIERLVDPQVLVARIEDLSTGADRGMLSRWVEAVAADLG